MKKLLFITCLLLTTSVFSQTVVYHENFELPTSGDSVTSAGIPAWAINTSLFHSGAQSYKTQVGPANADTSWLTTSAFSTLGNSNILLSFWHICKIEFADVAIVQVSNNNGVTWNNLTATQYLGAGYANFFGQGSKFSSGTYSSWLAGTNTATPTNTWWIQETFDLSTFAANAAQVKVRFKLYNGAGGIAGPNSNYGWLIDDINVTAAASELIPPVITYVNPLFLGTVYNLGPFTIKAKIADASGIQTAKLFYKINSGLLDSILMTTFNVDTMQATIPLVNDLDTIKYYIRAIDNSPAHNMALNPPTGFRTFVASSGIHFPYVDNFEGASSVWTATAVGTGTVWQLGTPTYGTTNSTHSPVKAWDVNLTTAYTASANCTLTSNVFDFSTAVNAKLSFWFNHYTEQSYDGTRLEYTTNGTTWLVLGTVGDPNAVNWYNMTSIYSSSLPAWAGTSGGWKKAEYTLTQLNNVVGPVQFRFIFTSDGSVQNDGMSIDDISIALPSPQDAGVTAVLLPNPNSCATSGNNQVEVVLKNFGTTNIVGPFNIAYKVDNGTPVIESFTGTVIPAGIDTFLFTTSANLTAGVHSIKCYTILPSDGLGANDTTTVSITAFSPLALPYINPLDAAVQLSDFCVTVGAQGRVQQNPIAFNTGTGGIIMDATTYTGWTTTPDTILASPYYVWNPLINSSHFASAKLIVNSATYSNLILKFDMKMLYLYSNAYTNFRVLVNGTQITPHFLPNGANSNYTTFEYSLAPFLPATTIEVEFQAKVEYPYNYTTPNGNGIYLDNVKIYEPPTQEAFVVGMSDPNSGCGLGNETVKISIKNTGSDTINGGLTATYQIFGGAAITPEVVSATILPNQIYNYSFVTPANLAVTTTDSTFKIKAWINLTGDPLQFNDSIQKSIVSGHTPNEPVSSNVSIPYGTTATLTATAADTLFWYSVPVGGTPLHIGPTYTTPVLYANTNYWVNAKAQGGSQKWTFDTGLEGWTPISSCSSTNNWIWKNDAGQGTLFAINPYGTTSQLIVSPLTNIAGSDSVTFIYNHRFNTENCCDEGYIAYRLDGGPWIQFTPMTGVYGTANYVSPNPISACAGTTNSSYHGTQAYAIHSGRVYVATHTNIEVALIFTSDGSVAGDGWYINDFEIKSSGGGCASNRIVDTVFVSGLPALDAGVSKIITPVTGVTLSTNEVVSVKIKNFGTSAISGFPVSYKINALPAVTETVTANINGGDSLTYTFTATADLSVLGTYNFTSYTSLVGDNTHPNDTTHKVVINQDYCISAALYTYDDDITNVTFAGINNTSPLPLGATYSDYTGITPGNISPGGSYPITVSTGFTAGTYSGYVEVYIDYNRDGVFTEPGEVAFGAAYTGVQTLSGTVNVPLTASVGYTRMRVVMSESGNATSVIPCGTYYYGETEDYRLSVAPLIPNDAGVTAIINPLASEAEAAVVPVDVTVKNFGTLPITIMDINYTVNGGTPVVFNWTGTLAPSATVNVTLPSLTVQSGNNTICAYTVLSGDSNTLNDQTCKAFYGVPQHDAGIFDILQPGSATGSGSSQSVSVVIKNFGSMAISAMDVNFNLNGVASTPVAWAGTLAPNAIDTIALNNFTVPSGNYSFCAYTSLVPDGDHTNDTMCLALFGIPTVPLSYFDNFDGGSSLWYDQSTGAGTNWQLGVPTYGTTNSVHSAPHAWDINLTTAYGASAYSSLYSPMFQFNNYNNVKLSFWRNHYSEGSWDGTRLEYTIDNGTTWNVLGTVADPNAVNWYTMASILSSSLPAWEGNSLGWVKSEYTLVPMNGYTGLVQFRFIFTSDGSVQYDGFSIDDFTLSKPFAIDAGVTSFITPNPPVVSGNLEDVTVNIMNYGLDTLTSIPVKYRVNGGTPVSETWTGTLIPGNSTAYLFTTQLNVPATNFSMDAYTDIVLDSVRFNDTTSFNMYPEAPSLVFYTTDFEGPNLFYSPGTLWQHGIPASTLINSAHSPDSCWKTNLTGNYGNSALQYLYTPKFNFSQTTGAIMRFWQWINSEAGADGGNVQYSTNNGSTWATLGFYSATTPDTNGTNWYNDMANGTACFDGNGTGWEYSSYNLHQFDNYASLVQFRFKFFSDALGVNTNGWAIDDFSITVNQIAKDAGVTVINNPTNTTFIGAPITVNVDIKNFGIDTLTSIPVTYKVNNNPAVNATWTGTLLPDSSVTYSFAIPYSSPAVAYDLASYSKLTVDNYKFNDTTKLHIVPVLAPLDAGVPQIVQPNGTTPGGTSVTVISKIKNYGADTLYSIPVQYKVNAFAAVSETWTGTLIPGDSVNYTFATPFTSPNSTYTICSKTILVSDAIVTNDENCLSIAVGIETFDKSSLYLMQNIPNPSNGITMISYNLPKEGKVNFNITNVLGQNIYSFNRNEMSGVHKFEFNANKLSKGIYYYSLQFDGKLLVKKMIVD